MVNLLFRQLTRNFASKCKAPIQPCQKPPKNTIPGARKRPPSGCIVGPSGIHPTVEGGYKIWRNMFFFVCVPVVAMCGYNTYTCWQEPVRQPFIKLEYMRIRRKKFFWCGGTDRSFFHNPHLNALPDGYEDEEEEEEEEEEE